MSEENGNESAIKPSHNTEIQPRERPQLSLKSNDEEILREVCLNNGISFKKIHEEGPQLLVLEMFFSGFPRLIGLHLFPNLTTLTVIGQSITRLEGIAALPKLKQLWIAECQLKRIEGLDKSLNLTNLYIYGNKISVIENIQHLTNLSVLWLNNNQIRNIENLSSLSKLKELNLAENYIEKIGSSLTANSQLEDLNLSGNPLWSLRDLTCLARLSKLTRLSLKDPLYQACPVSQLCNYSTHMMYHLPKVVYLDTFDVSSKHLIDLAESTVSKKKMFYNMRAKTIRRNMSELLSNVSDLKRELMQKPTNKLRLLNFVIKEMERDKASHQEGDGDFYDSDPESERDVKSSKTKPEKTSFEIKLETLIVKRRRWEKTANEIDSFAKAAEKRIQQLADMIVNRLILELETGGNVRFEIGQATDPWFTSCHDLVLSRFCAYDYRDLGVVGIKIHRIVRIHNRMLRTRFDKSIVQLTESNKGEYYPGVKNTAYKKCLEYLFWICDPEMPGGINESSRIPEEGFLDAETYSKLGRDAAVPLSNSIILADRKRINHCIKSNREKEEIDSCPFRYGQLIVAKTHLGKSVAALDENRICKSNYEKMDSVFRPRKKAGTKESDDGCECNARQCEWLIFDHNLVLPEYIIEFEYVTRLKSRCPFQNLNEDLMKEQPKKQTKPPQNVVVTKEDNGEDSDEETIKMKPEIKSRPRLVTLTDECILKAARVDMLYKVTTLNLHGNGLTKLRHLQALTNLQSLIVSFNELTRLDELSNLQVSYIDASFNKIYTLDGMKGMTQLNELNVSWNKLSNTREELSILRKHLGCLKILDFRNNNWVKASNIRLRAIGRLRQLEILDGKKVEEDESALALRCAAGSRISQLSLLTHSRIDTVIPRSLSLGDAAHVIIAVSRQKPFKSNENDTSWYSQVTTLNLDNQHITKISNLDRLENLKWVSFNENDLTRIEGLDACPNILELSLSSNCIAHLEGLQKLSHIQRLDLSHNCLTSLEANVFNHMTSLVSLSLESNKLTTLSGLQRCTALLELYVGNNAISNIRDVFMLKSLPNLVILDMYGNPMVSEVDNYRLFVIYHLRSLKALDGSAIAVRNTSKEMEKYQRFRVLHDLMNRDANNSSLYKEAQEGNMAKDTFGGRLTPDFVAEKLGHATFLDVRELDLPNCAIRTVDLGTGEQFINLRSVNLEHNNLQSFTGLIHLVNLRVLCLNHNHIECIVPKSKAAGGMHKNRSGMLGKNVDYFAESCAPVLENLEVLHLGYNGIKDMAALQLSRLPSLKALFLQGNEITKVDALDGLHDLRELVLDRNKIKQLSEYSFLNQWNLQELHLEENRLRDLSGLGCLENLLRLYLGSNRIQELSELDRFETLHNLVEISLVNNAVARRLMHRVVLVHRLPRLAVIDGILITEEERNKAEMYYADQGQVITTQPPLAGLDSGLPGISHYKPSVQVKVTNMQLTSPPIWNNAGYYEDEMGQRGGGRNKKAARDMPRQAYGLPGGGATNTTAPVANGNSRMQYTYLNQLPYSSSHTAEYVENIARLNQQRANKR